MSQEVEELQQQTVIIQQDDGSVMAYIQTEDGTQIPIDQATMEQSHLVATEDGGIEYAEGALTIAPEDGTMVISDNAQFLEETVEDQVEHVIDEDGNITAVPVDGMTISEEGMDDEDSDQGQYQNIIIQHMDIEEPLSTLRKLLEARLQCSLSDHEFYLQDSIPLDPDKNLVSQCVEGSGMVQINVEVKSQPTPDGSPRLNIVDILKPADEVIPEPEIEEPKPVPVQKTSASNKVVIPFPEEAENVTRWIVDQSFRKEQERLKIPFDPTQWNQNHVRFWIQWAVKEFTLEGVDVDNFSLTGKQLCDLKHTDFVRYIPIDKGDIFWTHLELLRKCKFVAVIQQPTPHAITTITVSTSNNDLEGQAYLINGRPRSFSRVPKSRTIMLPNERATPGNRTGNNGQIQLWQFLLELLTDKDCQEVIHWVGDEGEFKLNNPEMVAQLWGQRKNKPTMNYEKLSRALRYYYDGDMIAKVHGKRFVYKFVCDLRMLLGYTAAELNRLVSECAEKKLQKVRETLRPGAQKRMVEIERLNLI